MNKISGTDFDARDAFIATLTDGQLVSITVRFYSPDAADETVEYWVQGDFEVEMHDCNPLEGLYWEATFKVPADEVESLFETAMEASEDYNESADFIVGKVA